MSSVTNGAPRGMVETFAPSGLVWCRLSERQWRAIQRASGLPDSARERIEGQLALYKWFSTATARAPRTAETKGELRKIAALADKLITMIIGNDAYARAALLRGFDERYFPIATILGGMKPDVLATLSGPPAATTREAAGMVAVELVSGTPKKDALILLCQRLEAVWRLRQWAETAAQSLPPEVKGARKAAENHKWLVGRLDAILSAYAGRHVSRGKYRAYVKLCFAAADVKVGAGSIEEAIKACLRGGGEITTKNRR